MNKILMNLFIVASLFFVASCNNATSSEQGSKDSADAAIKKLIAERQINFKQFIGKFKMLQLPLTMVPFDMQESLGQSYLYGADTLFINTAYKDTSASKLYAYGMLPDSANSYKLVYFVPAEIYVPMMATFTKQGILISNKELYVGQCGADCGFTCKETITIDASMNIRSTDSIQYSQCDSKRPMVHKLEKYVLYRTGSIDKDGNVALSEMKRQDLK